MVWPEEGVGNPFLKSAEKSAAVAEVAELVQGEVDEVLFKIVAAISGALSQWSVKRSSETSKADKSGKESALSPPLLVQLCWLDKALQTTNLFSVDQRAATLKN